MPRKSSNWTHKNKWWRPPKINEVWLEKAKEVIADDNNVVCLTDEDLLEEINDWLDSKHTISTSSFEAYKRWDPLKDKRATELLQEFSRLYKKAIRKQKKNLLNMMVKEPDKRQKFARIIERKFEERNLRKIGETTLKWDKESPLFDGIEVTIVRSKEQEKDSDNED